MNFVLPMKFFRVIFQFGPTPTLIASLINFLQMLSALQMRCFRKKVDTKLTAYGQIGTQNTFFDMHLKIFKWQTKEHHEIVEMSLLQKKGLIRLFFSNT